MEKVIGTAKVFGHVQAIFAYNPQLSAVKLKAHPNIANNFQTHTWQRYGISDVQLLDQKV